MASSKYSGLRPSSVSLQEGFTSTSVLVGMVLLSSMILSVNIIVSLYAKTVSKECFFIDSTLLISDLSEQILLTAPLSRKDIVIRNWQDNIKQRFPNFHIELIKNQDCYKGTLCQMKKCLIFKV